jgi:Domain of unknown function (DUF4129)
MQRRLASFSRLRRLGLAALALLACSGVPRRAGAVPLLVRGSATLDARVALHGDALELSGTLKDESGEPIDASVRMQVVDHAGGAPRALPPAELCAPAPGSHVLATAAEYRITPDRSGAFCVHVSGRALTGFAELSFDGNRYYAPISIAVAIDASRRSLSLRFAPRPSSLALERPLHSVWVETRVDPSESRDEMTEAIQLELSFAPAEGASVRLGTSTVRAGERGLFTLRSRDLGLPGPGRLCVAFAGSPTLQPARRCVPVDRTAEVVLTQAGRLQGDDPETGVRVPVAVGTALGAVSSGQVEALVGGDSVGTAPVSDGAAEVVATFDAPHGGQVPMTLHYLPDAPWWRAGAELHVMVPVRAPSPWRRWPWAAAALAIALYVVQGWRRPARGEPKKKPRAPTLAPGSASLDVVATGPAHSGWRGTVLDAHDATPVPDARVAAIVPAFRGDGVVGETFTDAEGKFALDHVASADGARLQVSAHWHSTLVRALPAAGQLAIHLVSRRRALLDRLVTWAVRRGRPWHDGSDPTPGQVARAAENHGAPQVREWAEAVERAAYGPEPPDLDAERLVKTQEPEPRVGEPRE